MKTKKRSLICALALLPAVEGLAAAPATNDVKISLRAATTLTDNALRDPVDLIEERQDEYSADITGQYHNEWIALDTSYDASKRMFEKGSQEDRSILQGETELIFGNTNQPLNLLLSHSRRSLLNSPDAIDLLNNRDERTVVSVRPTAKWKVNASDVVALSVNYSQVSYKFEGAKDSSLQGINLAWQLGVSPVDTVVFAAQENKISFDGASGFNYKHQNASVKYSVKLANLSYGISIGGSRVIPESKANSLTRPVYDVDASYDTGYDTFKFIASKKVTDTSMGDGNNVGLGVASPDTLAEGIDLIDLSRGELSWSSGFFCERCKVNINIFGVRQDYQNTHQSFTEKGAGAGFNYRLSRSTSVYLSASHANRMFDSNSKRPDFSLNRGTIGFVYNFQKDLQLKVYRSQEKRDTSLFTESYIEHYTGLSLSYSF